eukprot:SAG11_NODE_103_length_16571_cov_49.569208_17_plen_153_part_00
MHDSQLTAPSFEELVARRAGYTFVDCYTPPVCLDWPSAFATAAVEGAGLPSFSRNGTQHATARQGGAHPVLPCSDAVNQSDRSSLDVALGRIDASRHGSAAGGLVARLVAEGGGSGVFVLLYEGVIRASRTRNHPRTSACALPSSSTYAGKL